ncbi:MAG: BadF/BadG/BcrA/BcrD ATPase family protein [Lachnospiraceae bacterium]|nr:BadF/BadG/BcrA/BcrD ATPase family protein [Lachnospiraceae bacterium]
MKYILGIDQGGTKTAAALMDESGNVCGTGLEKGAYFPDNGIDVAMACIERAVQHAMDEAQIHMSEIGCVVAGITGIDWPGDEKEAKEKLADMTGNSHIFVCNDCVIAMYGGTRKEAGAVICAGTGLNCAIRKKKDEVFVFGDYLGSDMQGGGALARRGARKVFDGELGLSDVTALKKLYLSYAKVQTVDDLLRMYMQDKDFGEEIKLIVPRIVTLAEEGDKATNELLQEFANDMSRYLYGGMKKMKMLCKPIDVVLAGSVFKGEGNPLTRALTHNIQNTLPQVRVIYARYEPVVGACIMGILQDKTFTEKMCENLERTAREHNMLR